MWRPAFNSDGSRLVQNMLFKNLNNTYLSNIRSANTNIAYQKEINVYYIVISKSTLFFPPDRYGRSLAAPPASQPSSAVMLITASIKTIKIIYRNLRLYNK